MPVPKKIMPGEAPKYIITKEDAADNPLVREGFSYPIIINDKIVAGFGITGPLNQIIPLVKIAAKIIESSINEQSYIKRMAKFDSKYRHIFNSFPYSIYQSDIEGKLLTANPALADILGYNSPVEQVADVSNISSNIYVYPEKKN